MVIHLDLFIYLSSLSTINNSYCLESYLSESIGVNVYLKIQKHWTSRIEEPGLCAKHKIFMDDVAKKLPMLRNTYKSFFYYKQSS